MSTTRAPAVLVDLHNDWREHLVRQLTRIGERVDPAWDSLHVAIHYFNLRRRLVPRAPRHVHFSREFTCPPQHQAAVAAIQERVVRGDDLTCFLSRLVVDLSANDLLLFDWDITHFHLGTQPSPDPRFISRTRDLLFARVTRDAFYMINVMPHGSWGCRQLLQILHDNWPDTIADYRLPVLGTEGGFASDDDIHRAREAGIQPIVTLADGAVYAPPGGGIMSTGHSSDAVDTAMQWEHFIQRLQRHVTANVDDFVRILEERGINVPPQLEFHLDFRHGRACVTETHTATPWIIPDETATTD